MASTRNKVSLNDFAVWNTTDALWMQVWSTKLADMRRVKNLRSTTFAQHQHGRNALCPLRPHISYMLT